MKFNVDGKLFQQQISAVSKVINSKNVVALLDNFLLRVEGDRLSITGADQENVMTAYMNVSNSEMDGEIAISAKRLLEVAKEVSNQPLSFEVNDSTKEIEIKFLNGHFNFMGVESRDYPERRKFENPQVIMLPAESVRQALESTAFAVCADSVRPVMAGVYWDIHPEDITFVSSDTHKLVRYVDKHLGRGLETSFILPAKPTNVLKSIISQEDGDIKIEFDEKGATFEVGDYVLTSLFINGNYPNYDRVIPQANPFELTIDRASFLGALRRMSIFSSKSTSLIVMELGINEIYMHCQDLDYGTQAEERITCSYEGNSMVLGFNVQFMIEILNVIDDETVVIQLSDPARPALFTPLQQKEGTSLHIIQMPMQVF